MTKRKTVSFNVIDTFCQLSESLADSGIRYLQGWADAPALATRKMDFKGKDHPSDDPVVKNLLLLADYLHITPQACLVFVAIYSLELTSREGIDWCDICGYFGINAIKSLSLRQYLSELTKKEIICCENPHGMLMYRSYCVHKDVESAMDSNIPYKKTKDKVEKLDRYQFCSKVGSLLHRSFDFEYECGLDREELFKKVEKMEFKIPFEKPTVEAKAAIWRDKLPWLDDKSAGLLAQKHDLSGGEIDNVARKSLMEEVVSGERPSLDTLLQWCEEEHFGKQSGNAIGFVA